MEVNGQYRVTVPDPDALDRLRTRNRMCMTKPCSPGNVSWGGTQLECALYLGPSRESSTEPMDTDEGARTTREIAESIRLAQGRACTGSVGHIPRGLTLPTVMDSGSGGIRLGEVRGGVPKEGPNNGSRHRGGTIPVANPSLCNRGPNRGGGPQPPSPRSSRCHMRSGPATQE